MDGRDAARAHFTSYLAELGVSADDVSASSERGGFWLFSARGGHRAWASARGVLRLDGRGDWLGFVRAHADPNETAAALARAMNQGATAILEPSTPSVARLPPEGRKHVTSPALARETDGTTTLTFWFGHPPSFGPTRFVARIGATTTIERTSLDALLPSSDEEAVWLRHLQSEDAQTRKRAALELGKRRSSRAVPHLVRLLSEPWADARRAAVGALVQIADTSAVTALVAALLVESDAGVGVEIAAGLGQLGGADAQKGLIRASHESKLELVRKNAAYWAERLR